MRAEWFTPSNFEDYRPEDPVPYEVVVDEKMGLEIGEQITLGDEKVRVVGKTESLMFVLDTPLLFMDVRIAQKLLLGNTPHVNMMVAKVNENFPVPEVATQYDEFETIETRTLKQTVGNIIEYYVDEPMKAVQFLRVMLWLAAGILVGMITYVTMLEKTQEIGVLKAIGAANRLCHGTPAETGCADVRCWCDTWAYFVLYLCGGGTHFRCDSFCGIGHRCGYQFCCLLWERLFGGAQGNHGGSDDCVPWRNLKINHLILRCRRDL